MNNLIKSCIRCNKYVLVTAARNEDEYIENCILSVISQSILPVRWVIVSDGSTDNTNRIVSKYAEKHNFILFITREGDKERNFGSQVESINTGYKELKNFDYEYMGNLDADISFGSDYFKILLEAFDDNPKLGLTGGFIHEKHGNVFKSRRFNNVNSVAHAVQFFRREVYDVIGGYIKLSYGGPDTYIETMVKMNGWEVKSIPELAAYHHRPTSSADGILKGSFNAGIMDYSLGYLPLYAVFKYIRRISGRPIIIAALARLMGFLWGNIKNEERVVSFEFIKYFRTEQKNKIKNLFSIKL